MAREKFERKNPCVNVGTIGHVGHSKTTLTATIFTVSARRGTAEPMLSLRGKLLDPVDPVDPVDQVYPVNSVILKK